MDPILRTRSPDAPTVAKRMVRLRLWYVTCMVLGRVSVLCLLPTER